MINEKTARGFLSKTLIRTSEKTGVELENLWIKFIPVVKDSSVKLIALDRTNEISEVLWKEILTGAAKLYKTQIITGILQKLIILANDNDIEQDQVNVKIIGHISGAVKLYLYNGKKLCKEIALKALI